MVRLVLASGSASGSGGLALAPVAHGELTDRAPAANEREPHSPEPPPLRSCANWQRSADWWSWHTFKKLVAFPILLPRRVSDERKTPAARGRAPERQDAGTARGMQEGAGRMQERAGGLPQETAGCRNAAADW